MPAVGELSTAKYYVDQAISHSVDEPTLVRNNPDNDFKTFNLSNISSITLNAQAGNENLVITKAYVNQFHKYNERNGRDLGIDFYKESNYLVKNNQDNNFNDNNLKNLDSITVNRDPTSENELTNKKYVDDSLGGGNILRFYQAPEICLKVSVGDNIYNLAK